MWLRKRSAGRQQGSSLMLLGAILSVLSTLATAAWPGPLRAQDDDSLQVSGRVLVLGGRNSAGGSFVLAGALAEAAPTLAQGGSADDRFELMAKDSTSRNAGAGCLCGGEGLIFQDGFESGDTNGWN